jgi:hypothetical protein
MNLMKAVRDSPVVDTSHLDDNNNNSATVLRMIEQGRSPRQIYNTFADRLDEEEEDSFALDLPNEANDVTLFQGVLRNFTDYIRFW